MNNEQLEILRKRAQKFYILAIICLCLTPLIILFLGTQLEMKATVIITLLLVILAIVFFLLASKHKSVFSLEFKNAYVSKSLEQIFDDLVYEPESGINESVIQETGMFDTGDRFTSNDYIKANYKGVLIEQSDVHVEEEETTTDSDGHVETHWVTLFKGRYIIFDFNKTFKANVQVYQKWFPNQMRTGAKYQKVELEDTSFNKEFKVYAVSEHDAFYILTPQMMQRLQNLASNIKGKMMLGFVGDKLHVAINNNKDSFEHGVFKRINEEEILKSNSGDIKLVTDFVDELGLDNNLFK